MEEKVLINNIKKFLNSADLVYKNKDFTSATILYFKALFSILDLLILKKIGKIPKDHSERFRILEKKFPEFYSLLNMLFPYYRNTYSTNIEKEICDKIKENVEGIVREQKIFE